MEGVLNGGRVNTTKSIGVLEGVDEGKEGDRGPGVDAGGVHEGSHGVKITYDDGGDGGVGGKGVEGVEEGLSEAQVIITRVSMDIDKLESTTRDELGVTRGRSSRRSTRNAGQNGDGPAVM